MDGEKKEKKYLDYSEGQIEERSIPPSESFLVEDSDEDELNYDENLDIFDALDKVNEIEVLIEEDKETEPESSPVKKKYSKEYIDIGEHKQIDEEDGGSWLDTKMNKNRDEEEDDNDDIKGTSKSNEKIGEILNKIKKVELNYKTVLFLLIGLIFAFMFLSRPTQETTPKRDNESNTIITPGQVFSPSDSQLQELSQVIDVFLSAKDSCEKLRISEVKVLSGLTTGEYTQKQIETLFVKSKNEKQTILSQIEALSVSSNLSELNTLVERAVRADLNSSKQVISDSMNGEKPHTIFSKFTTSISAVEGHIKNYSDELENVLIKYKVKYTRDGNNFSFQ